MSKGSKIVPVRIPDELYELMQHAIICINERRREEPYDVSSFIRMCIRHKLDHRIRSKRKYKRVR